VDNKLSNIIIGGMQMNKMRRHYKISAVAGLERSKPLFRLPASTDLIPPHLISYPESIIIGYIMDSIV
jgi:hypothetical protein